ncbi:hypothetical protein LZ496_12455 [Sphingomonas sp. NSE70-1]|uniref:Uncharacterized protein n=1 Tax=Sphingomonas caseinilyticus TaxID=2908205 RepID=A0ABT0RXH1_9SPHN|nr:hypothetical protein [Sphingomonas caseinilyticus]MCL6699591.1 hypothetical protein [Sphingomonas caseinilyticus]
MKMFLIGPALLGAAHVAGSIFADDTREIVRQRPAFVYSTVSQALANTPESGTMEFESGPPVPYSISVDRNPGRNMVIHVKFNGREAGQIDLRFLPENGGKETLMIARVESDGKVVREELAGTEKAKLGYAPDWLLTFAFGRSLRETAQEIERGAIKANPTI